VTELLIEVATWFYLHGWSQIRIARALDLDPSTVSRYLKRARDEGIVRIEIRRPSPPVVDLGRALAQRFGLTRAIVVAGGDEPLEIVAAAAAEHVEGLLGTGTRLGVSWGTTLAAVVRHMRPAGISGLTIAQLAGGLDDPAPGIQGHDLVRRLGDLYPGSQQVYLHAPAIVDSGAIRRVMIRDSSVRAALDAAAASDIGLVGIGGIDERSTLVRGNHLDPDDRRHLLAAGAVGNMNTRFFDADGQPVGDLDDRTVAITWRELRAIDRVVAVASGVHKVPAIAAALRTGCVDVLVTDDHVARGLLGATADGRGRGSAD
jgi:DNA-binding transcriptional regulator LsrR (DeoR family)